MWTTLTMLSLVALMVGTSCAPSPSPQPEAVPVVAPLPMYFTPLAYRYTTFISHPPPYTAYHAIPYSNSTHENNKPRLYLLACYVLPYYESPYLSLLCLIGLIGGSISQHTGLENANSAEVMATF